MARRAKFGRQPRAQPSLTATLVAIAREMQAQNDRNIMDAWKNGGVFEGKAVTDDRALAYWQKRLSTLDPADPMYDTIKSQIMQLQYGIEQSKMDLAHLQGKISDSAYAQFFLRWAKKVPQNSEWWRALQKDAARLMEGARANSRAAADKAKRDAFNAFVEDRQGDMSLANALTEAITKISKETGLSITDNGDRLLELLTADYARNPDEYRLLADAVKGQGFSGVFSHAWVARSLDDGRQAYKEVATRANKDGYASQYAAAAKGQSDLSDWGQNLDVWPVAKSYSAAYEQFRQVWDNPNASWMDKQRAAAKFGEVVGGLSKKDGIDEGTRVMLEADAARALGEDGGDAPSFGQAMLGHEGFTPDMVTGVRYVMDQQALMDANPGQFVYAPVDKTGAFDPTGVGSVGIVPTGTLPADAVYMPVPGLGGSAQMIAVQPHDIVVEDPNDPGAKPTLVGKFLSYAVGGQTITVYGAPGSDGVFRWSDTSPLADGVQATLGKDGNLTVTLPSRADPAAMAAQIDKQYGSDIKAKFDALRDPTTGALPVGMKATSVVYQRDKDGKVTARMDVSWDGKNFDVKQTGYTLDADGRTVEGGTVTIPVGLNTETDLAAAALAGSRYNGGDIEGVTFTTPIAAGMEAADKMFSKSQVIVLAQDPTFQQAFAAQTMNSVGTANPLDPRVVTEWNKITAEAKPQSPGQRLIMDRVPRPMDRADLKYPGQEDQTDVTKTDYTITMGGQSIKLPGLPAYIKETQVGSGANLTGLGQVAQPLVAFGQQVLGFLGGTKPATTTPTTTPAPTWKTTTTTTASPTTTTKPTGVTTVPTGTSAPTPAAAPKPAPAPGPQVPW